MKFDNLGSRKIKIVEIAQYAPRDMQEGKLKTFSLLTLLCMYVIIIIYKYKNHFMK